MKSSSLHNFALLFAACALLVVISGAYVTSSSPPNSSEFLSGPQHFHEHVAIGVTALAALLLAWILATERRNAALFRLGIAVLGSVTVEGGLSASGVRRAFPAGGGILHGYVAQLLFTMAVSIAVLTSTSWKLGPKPVEDFAKVSLRMLAKVAVILVLIQVALGATYRHQSVGVLAHIFGAMVVAVVVLLLGVLAVKQYPAHPSIRPAAIFLMSVTGLQVLLGFSAFVARLMTSQVTPAVIFTTVPHVTNGALTLAATFVLAMQVLRNVQPSGAERP